MSSWAPAGAKNCDREQNFIILLNLLQISKMDDIIFSWQIHEYVSMFMFTWQTLLTR